MPSPTPVNITINPERVISITEDITLTCTVQVLNSTAVLESTIAIDVTTEWFLSSSGILTGSQSMRVNSPMYTYSSTFKPKKVGNYSCMAKVCSSSPYLRNSSRVAGSIIVGK